MKVNLSILSDTITFMVTEDTQTHFVMDKESSESATEQECY